jgi:hypothetical protein
LLYFFLFLGLWIVIALSFGVYSFRQILRPALLIGLGLLGGVAFSLGYTRYLLDAGAELARQPHNYQTYSYFWPRLLDARLLLLMWANAGPLTFWHYDANMIFFPVTVLGAIVAAALGARGALTRYHAALGLILLILAVHCLVQPLHYPLYLLHLPLYNLNWEHWRVVYLLYFAVSLAAASAITSLLRGFETKRRRFFAMYFAGLVGLYAFWSATDLTHLDRIIVPFTAMLGFGVLAHAATRQLSRGHVAALGTCMIAGCLYLPVTRVPFYRAGPDSSVVRQAEISLNTTRSMRLIGSGQIAKAQGELLWFNDSVMAMFSRNGLTGYDTALQRREARLFSCFYSPDLETFRSQNPFLHFGVQSSIVWPDADRVLEGGKTLGAINEARLKLLGVDSLLWNERIVNLPAPRWDPEFKSWNHPLPTASTVSLLEGANPADVARLFSGAGDNLLAERILSHRQAANVRFDEGSGNYSAELPTGAGLVMIAYNVGRFYKPFVDGAAVNVEPTALPFLFVWKQNSQPSVLELRPQTKAIWITALAGLILGSLIMGGLKWQCSQAGRGSASASSAG